MTTLSAPMAEIGFGTGSLYGGGASKNSVELVRAALESGVRWLDTAPLYGHGEAESLVGEAIYGVRDQLILVSKVGILPTKLDLPYKVQTKLANIAQKVPGGGRLWPSPAPRRPEFHKFSAMDVRQSVEKSLRALRTDRLDYLLLHEVDPHEAATDELQTALADLVVQGKVLAVGTATQIDKTVEIAQSAAGPRFSVLQAAASGALAPLGPLAGLSQSIVLHSVLGPRLQHVLAQLKDDHSLRAVATSLGVDPDQPALAERLVAYAMRQPGVRAVLFSTSRPNRLALVAKAANLSAGDAEAGARIMESAG